MKKLLSVSWLRLSSLLLIQMILSSNALANAYIQGDLVPSMSLHDQYGQALVVNDDTRLLLFSRDMQGSKIIGSALEHLIAAEKPLPVYYADIQSMPSLIAKYVAIPKMQDLSYLIGLDTEGLVTRLLPSAEDQASLIRLDKRRIINIELVESTEALLALLDTL